MTIQAIKTSPQSPQDKEVKKVFIKDLFNLDKLASKATLKKYDYYFRHTSIELPQFETIY